MRNNERTTLKSNNNRHAVEKKIGKENAEETKKEIFVRH